MGKKTNPLRANTFRQETPEEPKETAVPKEPAKPEKPLRKKKTEKPARPKKEKKERKPVNERHLRVIGLFFLLIASCLLISFTSYVQTWKVDYEFANKVFSNFSLSHFLESPTPENWLGKVGALTAYLFISEWFGVASFLFILILFIAGMKFFLKISLLPLVKTLKYSFFGIVWTPVALSVIFPEADILFGVYGFELNGILADFLGYSGLILLLAFILLSFLIIAFNVPFRWIKKKEIPVTEELPGTILQEPAGENAETAAKEEKPEGNKMIEEPVSPEEKPLTSDLQVDERPERPAGTSGARRA